MRFGFQAIRAAHRDADREFTRGVPRSAQQARVDAHPAMPVPLRGIYTSHYNDHMANLRRFGLDFLGFGAA